MCRVASGRVAEQSIAAEQIAGALIDQVDASWLLSYLILTFCGILRATMSATSSGGPDGQWGSIVPTLSIPGLRRYGGLGAGPRGSKHTVTGSNGTTSQTLPGSDTGRVGKGLMGPSRHLMGAGRGLTGGCHLLREVSLRGSKSFPVARIRLIPSLDRPPEHRSRRANAFYSKVSTHTNSPW